MVTVTVCSHHKSAYCLKHRHVIPVSFSIFLSLGLNFYAKLIGRIPVCGALAYLSISASGRGLLLFFDTYKQLFLFCFCLPLLHFHLCFEMTNDVICFSFFLSLNRFSFEKTSKKKPGFHLFSCFVVVVIDSDLFSSFSSRSVLFVFEASHRHRLSVIVFSN